MSDGRDKPRSVNHRPGHKSGEGNWMIDEVKQKGKRGRKAFFDEPTKGVYIKLPIRLIEAIQKANVGGLTKYSAAAIETKAKMDKLV